MRRALLPFYLTHSFKFVAIICALVLGSTGFASAQQLPPRETPPVTALPEVVVQNATIETVILGSSIGWLLGAVAGVGAAVLIQPNAGDSYIGAAEWWLGGWIGSSLGAAAGAHFANRRQGNLVLGSVVSLGIAPLAALVSIPVFEAGGFVLIPAAQIGVSVIVERRSARTK
jgi:hypothetical protein